MHNYKGSESNCFVYLGLVFIVEFDICVTVFDLGIKYIR